jgi:alpha-tubulin suppressor-like RCC1 family protein
MFWNTVAMSADGTRMIAAGCDNYIYVSTDSGSNWVAASAPWNCWLSVASSADGTHLAAVSPSGVYTTGLIYTSTNAGVAWMTNNSPYNMWTAIASSADGTQLIAGAGGAYLTPRPIFISPDSGQNWVASDTPLQPWSAVASSADGTRLAAAGNQIFTMVTVPALPSAITLPASATESEATLNGTVNPNGLSTTTWLEWGTNSSYGNTIQPVSAGDGWSNVTVSATLSGLPLNTVYHYRVVATNELGRSVGEDTIFWSPIIQLNGPDLLTNECHTAFTDPGATGFGLPPPPPLAISAGAYHSLALLTNGSVVGWGLDDFGEIDSPSSATNVVAISAGGYHSLALRADGSMVYWGLNRGGIAPSETETDIVAIAAGYSFSTALKSDGTVISWGEYEIGHFPPIIVPANATNIVAIAAGYAYSLALKADGSVMGWGDNTYGETTIPENATNIIAISAGAVHSLALKAEGTVIAWGTNQMGQLDVPTQATNIVAIAAGGLHSMALRADGKVFVWGWGAAGQTNIPPDATNIVEISAGYYDCLAKRADGQVIGWGGDYYGQATVPDELNSSFLPVSVAGAVNVYSPGIYTLIYTVTNSAGGFDTASRTVVVVDTTPPIIFCPTNIVVEFTSTNGAVVNFSVQATDLCAGYAQVTCSPPSGSTFAIGTNNVQCVATDDSGNSSQSNFCVVVLGARGVMNDVLDEMITMRAALPRQHVSFFDLAIAGMKRATTTNLWVDETHLNIKGGSSVFTDVQQSVEFLLASSRIEKNLVPQTVLNDWINRLVRATRLLALVELNAARTTRATSGQLRFVILKCADGDQCVNRHQYALAIVNYQMAWNLAAQLVNKSGKEK